MGQLLIGNSGCNITILDYLIGNYSYNHLFEPNSMLKFRVLEVKVDQYF